MDRIGLDSAGVPIGLRIQRCAASPLYVNCEMRAPAVVEKFHRSSALPENRLMKL